MKLRAPALAAFLLALACSDSGPERAAETPPLELDPDEIVRLEEAYESLERAPDRVRQEVLKSCVKWKHLDRECDHERARMAQLECWLSDGLPSMKQARRQGLRHWSLERKTMRHQNLCMARRRWRKIKGSGDI